MTSSPPKNETHDEDNLFYFESDHLALKGNPEYSELLKTIFVLESQRKRAIDDYNKVVELQKELLQDPLSMVQKFKNGEQLGVPDLQQIVEVPKINWSKFNVSIPKEYIKILDNDTVDSLKVVDLKNKISKTSHSKPWTVEEQKRLEELLVIYPPEEVELRRFKKIAAALGTRTFRQVTSRVQKYFLKLRKAGLPIPGRIPRFISKCSHKHQRLNHYMQKPSTFFPDLDVPVYMDEDEEVPGPSQGSKSSDGTYNSQSSNYLLTNSYHEDKTIEGCKSESDLKLDILKRVRNEKLLCSENLLPEFCHLGFKCDYCNEEPISGSRWHCITCKTKSIDFCTDCMLSQLYSDEKHPLNHKFVIIRDDKAKVYGVDSSSESISGSAFDSNKNVDSSDTDSDVYFDINDENDINEVSTEFLTNHENKLKISPTNKMDHKNDNELNTNEFIHELDIKQEVEGEDGMSVFLETSNEFGHDFDIKVEDTVVFSETQNVSYGYLHSSLFAEDS